MRPSDPFPAVSELGPEEEHPAGALFFRQGHRPRTVSLIVGETSLVKKVRLEANGEEALVTLRGPGWMLGAAPALLGTDYISSAIAVTTCRLRSMPADALRRLSQRNAEVAGWIARTFARVDREHEAARAELLVCPSDERCARTLKRLVDALRPPRRDGWIVLGLPFSRQDLAHLAGISREYLYDIVAKWKRAGVLRDERGRLLLLESHWVKRWSAFE